MAIELPGPVAQLLNFIGIPWININEDKVRDFATHTRQFAQDISDAHGDAEATLKKLGSGYEGMAYESLMRMWGGRSSSHVKELVEACHVLAAALDGGADFIEAQKGICIGQLGAMAATFLADQAAAVMTAGLAEAALPAIEEGATKLVEYTEQQLEQYIIGEITNAAMQPLTEKIENMVVGLVIPESGSPVEKGSGFRVDHHHLDAHAQLMQAHADKVDGHVAKFASKLDALDFSS
jgi:uncharacterized protein YukE